MSAEVQYSTAQIAALDKLARAVVLGRAEWCEACGLGTSLEWAHVRRRRFLSTRWLPDAALALCRSCHTRADSNGDQGMIDLVGVEQYDRLTSLSLESPTRSVAEIRASLRALL